MKRALIGCAALSCALGLVECSKVLRRSANDLSWSPARETPGYYMLPLGPADPPSPTPPPEASKTQEALRPRDSTDNTCGYVSGWPDYPLWCDHTAHCAADQSRSFVGCCNDDATSCPIFTTCLDSTDWERYTTYNGYTLWCGRSTYPHCITHVYQDAHLTGYTMLGCAVAAGTDSIWYSPLYTSTSTSRTRGTATTTSEETTGSSSDSPTTTSTTSSTPTPTPEPPPPPSSSSSSSDNVGVIVGGVVGGLGAIAMIILGIWALLRYNDKQKQKNAAAAAAAAAAGGPPPAPPAGPHMSQQPGYLSNDPAAGAAGFSALGPRSSIAKPGAYGSNDGGGGDHGGSGAVYPDHAASVTASSPSHSPLPAYQRHGSTSPPPRAFVAGHGQYGSVSPGSDQQPQQQQAQQQQQQQQNFGAYGYAVEMPTERGHGELRELQG